MKKALLAARRLLLGLLVAVVVLVAAWLPFNLPYGDAAPQALPADLALPARRLPDERNAAFAMLGLHAERGRDAQRVGLALWAADEAAARPDARSSTGALPADHDKRKEPLGEEARLPEGAPLRCASESARCVPQWFAGLEALARQRELFGIVGERCDRHFGGAFEFDEPVPQRLTRERRRRLDWAALADCSRWFLSGAVLAAARGQRDIALERLRQADRLQRTVSQGTRSILGASIASRLARQTYDTMAAIAIRDPASAGAIAVLLEAPLDTRDAALRWVPLEAASTRALVDLRLPDAPDHDPVARLARLGIGVQPERTKQGINASWQAELVRLRQPWPKVLASAREVVAWREQHSGWFSMTWRNSFGEVLAEPPDLWVILARQADHELHRDATALVLALQRQQIPAEQRAEAAKSFAATPLLRERLVWEDGGRTLMVWGEVAQIPGFSHIDARDEIRFTWP